MKNAICIGFIALFVFSSCASYDAVQYGQVDPSEKTISLPTGGDRLVGMIKKYLANNQWEIFVYTGPEKTENISESETIRYRVFPTKYTCMIDYKVVDMYLDGDYQYRYDITLIDNKAGKEVFTLSGLGKGKEIVNKFISLMENKYTDK